MFKFHVDETLPERERWLMLIIRNLNLFLLPLKRHFEKATVAFFQARESTAGDLYHCQIEVQRKGQEPLLITGSHGNGLAAIGQAMARANRTLTRGYRLKRAS